MRVSLLRALLVQLVQRAPMVKFCLHAADIVGNDAR
jgi:hypothetical protein